MARPPRRSPEDLLKILEARFRSQRRDWFSGDGAWPLSLPLGVPSEREATVDIPGVRRWVAAWEQWRGPGEVIWTERQWGALGTQRIPDRVSLSNPEAVVALLGLGDSWRRATARRAEWLLRWPALAPILSQHLTWFMEAADIDVARMVRLLDWLLHNPHSRLYPRQLPVPGLDTKWLAGQENRVSAFLGALGVGDEEVQDIHARCGLRRSPVQIRIRLLDPALRAVVGGLGDIQAPVEELGALALRPTRVVVVENVQTGLAFGDLSRTVLIMGLGYGVECLGQLPWCARALGQYWGDIDTHGFAILDRARAYLPGLESILMDEECLLRHQALWVREPKQHGATSLTRLSAEEQSLYQSLKTHRFGADVRLEQERIDWGYAWAQFETLVGENPGER